MSVIERVAPGISSDLEVTVTIVAEGRYDIIKADRIVRGIDVGNRQVITGR